MVPRPISSTILYFPIRSMSMRSSVRASVLERGGSPRDADLTMASAAFRPPRNPGDRERCVSCTDRLSGRRRAIDGGPIMSVVSGPRSRPAREDFLHHAPLRRGLAIACVLLLSPRAAPAQAPGRGIAIEHDEIGCVVAGKFSVVDACFAPGTELARARVYFRPEGTPSWYYVDNWGHRMPRAQATCLQTTLPKAKKSLVNKHVEYYLEAVGKSMGESQSAHYSPLVVTSEGECKDKKPAAVLPGAIGNVLPAVPAGFAVGAGISAGTVAAVVGAGVVGAGVGVA